MIKKCLICNNELYIRPSHYAKGKGKYCSKKCYYKSKIGNLGYWLNKKRSKKTKEKIGKAQIGRIPWNKGKQCFHSGSFQSKENHWNWKGGKTRHNSGYILVYQPNHPYRDKSNYIMEHRLAMEQILGRYLTRKEIVHHKNGIKDDNRPENLVLTVLNKNWHPCLCPKCGFEFLIK